MAQKPIQSAMKPVDKMKTHLDQHVKLKFGNVEEQKEKCVLSPLLSSSSLRISMHDH